MQMNYQNLLLQYLLQLYSKKELKEFARNAFLDIKKFASIPNKHEFMFYELNFLKMLILFISQIMRKELRKEHLGTMNRDCKSQCML